MKKFVMVSGVDPNTTLDAIDEEIIRLTGKKKAKILFVPTASGDDIKYCERYKGIYEGKFGCDLEVLYLFKESPSEEEIREKVFSSDIVYIGGGSTEMLMEYLHKFNVDKILREAYERGIVLAGISAGSVCLGQYYFYAEDPKEFENDEFKDFIKVDCLGFFNFMICPHYNLEGYGKRIVAMVKEYNLLGIALENNCAIEVVNDTYRIIRSKDGATAYKIYIRDGQTVIKKIDDTCKFRSIDELVKF